MSEDQEWCPLELVDHICSFIDRPVDLLSVARASKTYKEIVVTNHLPYSRRLRCNLRNAAFWKSLHSIDPLLSRIRYLEIVYIDADIPLDESPVHSIQRLPVVPPSTKSAFSGTRDEDTEHTDLDSESQALSSEEVEEAVQCLANVVSRMHSLKHFSWKTIHPPDTAAFQALSQRIHEVAQIREIELMSWNSGDRVNSMESSKLGSSKLWSCQDLSRFSYSEYYDIYHGAVQTSYVQPMTDMILQRCQMLEDLQLFFCCASHWPEMSATAGRLLIDMFSKASWPRLRRLTVEGCVIKEHASQFFARHPAVEALSLTDSSASIIDLTLLPSLRHLEVGWVPEAIELSPTSISSLQHLDVTLLQHIELGEEEARQTVVSFAPNLKSLVICSRNFKPLTVKNLLSGPSSLSIQRLALEFDWSYYDPLLDGCSTDATDCLSAVLRSLPNLTHFSPIYLGLWAGRDEKGASGKKKGKPQQPTRTQRTHARIDKALRRVTFAAPNLAYAGIKVEDYDLVRDKGSRCRPMWVKIERNRKRQYSGWATEQSTQHRADVDVALWGDIYYGAGKDMVHQPRYKYGLDPL